MSKRAGVGRIAFLHLGVRVVHQLKHRRLRRFADEFSLSLVLLPSEGSTRREDDGTMNETALERARAGEADAFQELVEPHRRELLVHCYRILGSLQDAEDALQEVLLSAWRALDHFDGRSLRAWLYRIATNRCLNYLRDEGRRPESTLLRGPVTDGLVSSDEPWWLEPYPDALIDDVALGPEARYDARESIALSFVTSLQHLPPQQRVVLVLRDVLGFPAAEVAGMLGTTRTSVNSALVRARNGLRFEKEPGRVPLPNSAREKEVVDRFVDAFQDGDLDQLVALLTSDAKFTMPPEPLECSGSQAIVEYLRRRSFWGQDLKLVATRANGQPAFGYYRPDPNSPIWRASGLLVLTLAGDQISAITRFGDRGVLGRFGLPRTLAKTRLD
jgi:RNA polymerase sigma-70 factor (TIGR02960 family)